jgi:hypothetical protein
MGSVDKKVECNFNSFIRNAGKLPKGHEICYNEKLKIQGEDAANNLKKYLFGESGYNVTMTKSIDDFANILCNLNAAKNYEDANSIIGAIVHGYLDHGQGIIHCRRIPGGSIEIKNKPYSEKECN